MDGVDGVARMAGGCGARASSTSTEYVGFGYGRLRMRHSKAWTRSFRTSTGLLLLARSVSFSMVTRDGASPTWRACAVRLVPRLPAWRCAVARDEAGRPRRRARASYTQSPSAPSMVFLRFLRTRRASVWTSNSSTISDPSGYV